MSSPRWGVSGGDLIPIAMLNMGYSAARASGGAAALVGIDVNRDYLAMAFLGPAAEDVCSHMMGYLAVASKITEPLYAEKRPQKVAHLTLDWGQYPVERVALAGGVYAEAKAYYILMPLPPRLEGERRNWRRLYGRWRRLVANALFRALGVYARTLRCQGGYLAIALEDLRGMAQRRGLSEIEYARIWRWALGRFRDEDQPDEERRLLKKSEGYRLLVGRGLSLLISLNPRGTSSYCALCNAEGVRREVKEIGNRNVRCEIHGVLNRDVNAALNIAIEAMRIIAGEPRGAPGEPAERPKAPEGLPTPLCGPRDEASGEGRNGNDSERKTLETGPKSDALRGCCEPGALRAP